MNLAGAGKWVGIFLLLIPVGCREPGEGRGGKQPIRQCFLQLKRQSYGRLVLRQPIACTEPTSRYRLEGPVERPARVSYLDSDGKTRLTYRVQYSAEGRPILEERVYHTKPQRFRIKARGDPVVVAGTMGGEHKSVTIRTQLDAQGRPVKMEKFVGADRAYSVVREYSGGALKSESTYDGAGQLKFRSNYLNIDGRRIERMVDGSGKVLMERVLDTSGGPPVQHPEVEK